jgi:hypothetical protein
MPHSLHLVLPYKWLLILIDQVFTDFAYWYQYLAVVISVSLFCLKFVNYHFVAKTFIDGALF